MDILYRGDSSIDDICLPIKGKNEWGVDTLVRTVRGARPLGPAYLAALTQGDVYQGYYLQTWTADENPIWATITLNYKGLLYGTPLPLVSNSIVPSSGGKSASYESENSGKGRVYRKDNKGADVYTTGAQNEFGYDCPQTVYRYIALGQPSGPAHDALGFSASPRILNARTTTADGASYGLSIPFALSSLAPAAIVRSVGFTSNPIVGTPYFECEDVVRAELA
jgi:hypothetical protein